MAKPRVFVSSTYYDLKHLRSSLENFIESLGYEPVLSEKGNIAYTPDRPLDESCYREVKNADIYVLIIGGRYGSERSGRGKLPKAFFERYDSITREEYKSAVGDDIPVYVLIERSVYADFENFLRNRDDKDFSYAHVDSVNVFYVIEEILSQERNNPVYQFERYGDIESWLREQWAGFFKELLNRSSSQAQLASLAAQVKQLGEINETLRRYLEEVVSRVAPKESEKLIRSESRRLAEAQLTERLRENFVAQYLTVSGGFDLPTILSAASRSGGSLESFARSLEPQAKDDRQRAVLRSLLTTSHEPVTKAFDSMFELIKSTPATTRARRRVVGHAPLVRTNKTRHSVRKPTGAPGAGTKPATPSSGA